MCPTLSSPKIRIQVLLIQPKGSEHLPQGRFFPGPWGVAPQPCAPAERQLEGTLWWGKVLGQMPEDVTDNRDRPERWGGRGEAQSRGVHGGKGGE